jgi:RNA polymerase-associated protein LEO1
VDEDGLTSPERRQRKAMEYEEDDQEEPQEVQLRDAAVQIPNLPVPKSSDGNVSDNLNMLRCSLSD